MTPISNIPGRDEISVSLKEYTFAYNLTCPKLLSCTLSKFAKYDQPSAAAMETCLLNKGRFLAHTCISYIL